MKDKYLKGVAVAVLSAATVFSVVPSVYAEDEQIYMEDSNNKMERKHGPYENKPPVMDHDGSGVEVDINEVKDRVVERLNMAAEKLENVENTVREKGDQELADKIHNHLDNVYSAIGAVQNASSVEEIREITSGLRHEGMQLREEVKQRHEHNSQQNKRNRIKNAISRLSGIIDRFKNIEEKLASQGLDTSSLQNAIADLEESYNRVIESAKKLDACVQSVAEGDTVHDACSNEMEQMKSLREEVKDNLQSAINAVKSLVHKD